MIPLVSRCHSLSSLLFLLFSGFVFCSLLIAKITSNIFLTKAMFRFVLLLCFVFIVEWQSVHSLSHAKVKWKKFHVVGLISELFDFKKMCTSNKKNNRLKWKNKACDYRHLQCVNLVVFCRGCCHFCRHPTRPQMHWTKWICERAQLRDSDSLQLLLIGF